MASNQFVTIAILAIVLPTVAMATEYIVGDAAGWTVNFDYAAWAKDKVFKVGDKLVFQYDIGSHNVFKVNGTAFQNCFIPPLSDALATGNDTIVLGTPGKKWYICGIEKHCAERGQKLTVNVESGTDAPAPSPAPSPSSPESSAAYGIMSSGYKVLIAAVVAVAMIVE